MENEDKVHAASRDGLIDFRAYTTEQLNELRSSIDPERFPLNHASLVRELKDRDWRSASEPTPKDRWDIVFTRSENLWSWFQAKRRWQWFYGHGFLEVQGTEVVLNGWQRTWLGMPVQAERHTPLECIRNVGRDESTVVLEVTGWLDRRRKIEFECESRESALVLCQRLPDGYGQNFEREWLEMRAFHRALYAPGRYPWAATALVLINVLTFLTFSIVNKSWLGPVPQMLTVWGSNFGPLTIDGQWWRLLSSLFLHLSPLHLLVNMWVLWNVGRLAERLFGHTVLLCLYFLTGLFAGLATIAWDPAQNVIGSSGAIFGLLGAVLASTIRPRHRTPSMFLKAHWPSLLLFVVFNLLTGFLQSGIANAAHVGGLVSGAVLGPLIAIPKTEAAVGRRYLFGQISATVGAAIGVVLVVLAIAPGIGAPRNPVQDYWRSHQWFIAGEAENLREWQSLLTQAQSGRISEDDLAVAFDTKIRPFWESACERTVPDSSLPKGELPLAEDVHAIAVTRRDWAKAISDGIRSQFSNSGSNLQYYLEKTYQLAAHLERRVDDANADQVSRAVLHSTPAVRIRSWLLPTSSCVRSPITGSTKDTDSSADGPKHREEIGCAAQRAFRSGDFDALERLFAMYPAGYADPLDGGSDRHAIQAGLDDLFEYGNIAAEEMFINMARWRRLYPDSVLPGVIEAAALTDWGWAARGHGYATSISPQQMQLFAYRNYMAEGLLEDTRGRGEHEPLWYAQFVTVKLDINDTRGEIESLFDEGMEKFPHFLPLYRAELRVLMPRWGGSYQKVDELINATASKEDPSAGDKIYARLYWSYATLEGDDVDIFTESMVSWPRVAGGFDLLLKEYPGSDYLLNGYAYMACRAKDAAKYHELRAKLNSHYSSTAWSPSFTPEACDKNMS